ncbi:hypothetical protein DX932_11840 [Bacillus cereus]|uniref:Transposon Tn7 transposition protein TnsD C-termianl domain-containing protein n=1 Tax=Bacillus cereus TaxID=1396 RepID=A0A9W7Q682_BACCE|nr:hypothetical protein DX932_11840 [Bacillus cereus]
MIPFFPRIYEDELFYSVLARYHRYSGNVKSIKTMRDLYGENIIRVYSHIDRKLKRLHEQVKIFDIPILEELIAKHTFYFYYTNFKGEEIKRRLKEVILNGEECGVVRLIGMKYNRYFKYCSHCIREDIEKYGETYWHLQHQIFGVHVCLKHNTILCNSDVYWNNYSKKRGLFEIQGATLENCPVDRKSAVFCKNTKQKLVIIAKELLKVSRGDCNIIPDELSRIYRYLLFKKGYMKGKFVNSKKFYHDFIKYYGEEVLELLNLNFDSNKRTNWVISIVKKGRRVFSPLQHILIIVFLGEKINTISQYRSLEESLFGEGPYPCLNPFTKHYLEYKIDTFELKLNQGNHIGVFTCNCGFTFSCLLKDYNEKKQFSIHQIIGMNKEWNNYFELLMSGGLKQETLYHLDKEVIMLLQKKYLLYRQGKKRMLSCKPSSEKLEQYRKQWLEYRENYSNF